MSLMSQDSLKDDFQKILRAQYDLESAKKNPSSFVPLKDTKGIFEFFDKQSPVDKIYLIKQCGDLSFLKALSMHLGETYIHKGESEEYKKLHEVLFNVIDIYTKEIKAEIESAYSEGLGKNIKMIANPKAVEGTPQLGYLTLESVITTYKKLANFSTPEDIFGSQHAPKQLDEVISKLREIADKHPNSVAAKTLTSLNIPLKDPRPNCIKLNLTQSS